MEKEIKDILEKPFDPADIGKDYNKNAYVKPHLIIRRLNKAYDQNGWHFELLERIVEHDTIIQFGRLGIPNDAGEMVWKENCGARRCSYMKDKDGRPSDKRLDVGNDYKSAVSNCLKRCAMMHGIALDLYGDPEQSERTGADSSQKQKNAPNKPPTDGKQGKGTGSAEGGMKPDQLTKVKNRVAAAEKMAMAKGLTQADVDTLKKKLLADVTPETELDKLMAYGKALAATHSPDGDMDSL